MSTPRLKVILAAVVWATVLLILAPTVRAEPSDALLPAINNGLVFMLGIVMSLLLGIVIWLAKKVDQRLDDINKSLRETNKTLIAIDRDLRNDLGNLDRRLTRVETHFEDRRL